MSDIVLPGRLDREERVNSVLPVVETDLFADNAGSTFWVGKVNDLGTTGYDEALYNSVAKLRANVYIDEKRYLGESARNYDGTETDVDDHRSIQFAAFENMGDSAARTIACGRMIVKLSEDEPLPIERYFPEVFAPGVPKEGSVEISRFISRHANKLTQHAASLAIIRAMTYESTKINVPTDYCIIERPLLKMLGSIGLPVVELGESKDIPEQNGVLYPVEINPHDILETVRMGSDEPAHTILQTFFANEEDTAGQGFYPETLMRI